jgi:putative phosphoesterase
MLVGIISDTHGRADAMAAAVQLLQKRSAAFFIHCGDVGGPAVLDHLAGLPAAFVWGNCDFDRANLSRYGEMLNIRCYGTSGELDLDGKSAAFLHGDDHKLKHRLFASNRFDYLFFGHTHVCEHQLAGRTHLINPGALHRANPKTVALLDTASDSVEFIALPGPLG